MPLEAELGHYFSQVATGRYTDRFDVDLNLLDRTTCEQWTRDLADLDWVRRFDGLVLDDPNTSNHHVLLRRPPLEGAVLYLNHDGDTRVVFPSLAALVEAADAACAGILHLWERHPEVSPQATDQASLSALIAALLDSNDAAADMAVELIPSMDLTDIALLSKLAVQRNFFLGEAVALQIAKRPSAALLSVAQLCAQHPHRQVAGPGAQAVHACKAG